MTALILVVFSSGCLEEEKISEEKTTEEKEENINAIPKAMISTSVSNVSLHGEEFVFEGTAEDSDGKIVSYEWKSSIDGILSTEIKFTISTLSIGKHNISFRAQDNQSDWSEIDSIDLLVKPNFWGDNCEDVPDEICKVRTAPDFELVDHRNLPVNMSQFIGDIVIINFFYTHSPDTGPATIYQMKKLSESLENKNVTILTITVDPERDTPDRLTDFSQANNASWAFLTSNEDNSSGYMSSIWLNYGIYPPESLISSNNRVGRWNKLMGDYTYMTVSGVRSHVLLFRAFQNRNGKLGRLHLRICFCVERVAF